MSDKKKSGFIVGTLKFILKTVLWILLLLLIALAAHPLWLGPTVKGVANCAVPGVTNTGFDLAGADVNLYSGVVQVDGLALANPEGASVTNAVSFKRFRIDINPASVATDEIEIREIFLDGLFASYVDYTDPNDKEFSGSNWDWIVKQLGVSDDTEESVEEAGKKKVLIGDLYIKDTSICVGKFGVAGTIPLPDIRLSITKEGIDLKQPFEQHFSNEGFTLADLPKLLWNVACKSVTSLASFALEGAGKLAGAAVGVAADAAGAAVNLATDAAGAAVGAAKEALENVDVGAAADAAKEAAGKALESVGDVGGKALESVGDVGGKAVEAVGDIGGKTLDAAGEVGGAAVEAVGNAAGKAGEVLGDAAGAAGEAAGKAVDAVGGALKSLNPFGK